MNYQFYQPFKKIASVLGMVSLALMLTQCAEEPKYVSLADSFADVETAKSVKIDFTNYNPPKDVASQSQNATISELAEFAWLEFVALNWPYDTNSRSFPDKSQTNGFITASAVGGPGYTPVWQTYWHRNELFPPNGKKINVPTIGDANPPKYQYNDTYAYGGSGTGDYTLWNNLDEVNELGQDVVYAHSTTSDIQDEYQVLYEAKMNYSGSRYIYDNLLFDSKTRIKLKNNTAGSAKNQGICDADTTQYICLPCGDIGKDTEGNIEIKAAWRKLTTKEVSSNKYHTQNVIYYKNVMESGSIKSYYENATMGLVGLHIIHKTKTFPTYVFATFEHVDNLDSGIVYTELENTPFGDKAKDIEEISRTHPIPSAIEMINKTVQGDLQTNNSVWQNYKLINVQAKPVNKTSIPTDKEDDPMNSYYYLSNSVIESNIELQTFTGTLKTPDANNVTYQDATTQKPNLVNMGGCMGCHGNAQQGGADFNFLIANAPFTVPEFTGVTIPGCPPGAEAKPLNTWADVQKFLNDCAILTKINNTPTSHGPFWDMPNKSAKENYNYFTGNDVFGTKICDCTKPGSQSNIIQYLKGTAAGPRMPGGGGPYFTMAQIAELETWITNGCKYD